LFGFSVAMVYGLIQVLHLVFGLFFALVAVCAIRGISLHLLAMLGKLPGHPAKQTAAPKPSAPSLAPLPTGLVTNQQQAKCPIPNNQDPMNDQAPMTNHSSFVIRHSSLALGHWSLVIFFP